jgi:hypothetical protein
VAWRRDKTPAMVLTLCDDRIKVGNGKANPYCVCGVCRISLRVQLKHNWTKRTCVMNRSRTVLMLLEV